MLKLACVVVVGGAVGKGKPVDSLNVAAAPMAALWSDLFKIIRKSYHEIRSA